MRSGRKKVDVCFFTVCGGGVEYEFLLGSILQHASMGRHIVLDVTPAPKRRVFKNLPKSVEWIYEDEYLSGDWKVFRCRQAVLRAMGIAVSRSPDVVMHLDCDEFLTPQAVTELFPIAVGACVEHRIVNWGSDGNPHINAGPMKPGGARRIWDARIKVEIPRNGAWPKHPHYNGNPDRHPTPVWPAGAKVTKSPSLAHHHLHYAIKEKDLYPFKEWEIGGWADWPEPLDRWKNGGAPPSSDFS